jgi:hypothetical protein
VPKHSSPKRKPFLRPSGSHRAPTRKRVAVWVSGLATFIGTVTALLTFFPRPTVTSADPVDPNNPFSVSFTVANNGLVPLTHVDAVLAFKHISYAGVVFRGYEPGKADDQFVRFSVDRWNDHFLAMDDRFTVSTAETFLDRAPPDGLGRLEDATIAIIVAYQAWPLPHWLRREKEFRFRTFRQTNGQIYWFADVAR